MIERNEKFLWLCALATSSVVATLAVLFYPVENPDCSARYALMADAFARGEWYESFHPRFCVLFQVLTGSLTWLLGCSGLVSCQIVSAMFMGLSIVPYWHVMRRLFGDSAVAWVSVGILVVIPRISGDAMNGLRDTGRILGIALWLLGFLRMLEHRPSALLQASGLFMLVSLKIDCFVPAAVMCAATVAMAAKMHCWKAAVSSCSAFLVAMSLVCLMVWSYTGWFVPAPQYIAFLKGFL